MLTLTLALTALAFAVPAQDTAMPCYGAHPDDLVPRDGASGVSPDAVPAMLGNANCESGPVDVTLTDESGETQTTTVSVEESRVYWLTTLTLAPNTAYTLTASGGEETLTSAFRTGGDALPALPGAPTLAITGSTLAADSPLATVSLELTLAGDVDSDAWEVRRGGTLVAAGLGGNASLFDSFGASDGDEICYRATEYGGAPSISAESTDTCVTLSAENSDKVHGCASAPGGGPLAALGGLFASLALLRRGARPGARG